MRRAVFDFFVCVETFEFLLFGDDRQLVNEVKECPDRLLAIEAGAGD